MDYFDPSRVLDVVAQRCREAKEGVYVYWLRVTTSRDAFAGVIEQARGDLCVVPVVVRGDGFQNPNAILSDLNKLIADNESTFCTESLKGTDSRRIVILLLGRASLQVPQLSSPTTLPAWFPGFGGQTLDVTIEDLEAIAAGPLNAPESRISDIARHLFDLEKALIARLIHVLDSDHNAGNAFFSFIKDEKKQEEGYRDFLGAAFAACQEIRKGWTHGNRSIDAPSV
jgi:hypothetical protein